ncbi:MAG: ATP-binding protein [Candidatus Omnitrophota bacterium]
MKEIFKEVILSNREFILKNAGHVVRRESFPSLGAPNKVAVLYGVRRSGKTFILYDLFRNYKDTALYVDFEDERLADFQVNDFENLRESFLELDPSLLSKDTFFLLDEIQNVPGWEKFCRRMVEKEKMKVVVTGSSSRMMPYEIHTSLRGRSWSTEITPFSFREYLKTRNINIDRNLIYTSRKVILKKFFSEYLKWGGFPEVVFSKSPFDRTKILSEYLSAIFFRDLVERYKIDNITLLESLLDRLLTGFARKFSLSSFYKQYQGKFPFSKDSLFNYYKCFLRSMLIFEVKKFSESSYTRMRNPAKIYLIDQGLAKRVTSDDLGWLLENVVFLELRKKSSAIFYFEEEKECDFITREGNRFSAYQVSFELNEGNKEREVAGLVSCCKRLHLKNGTILTYDQEEEIRRPGVKIMVTPVWKWLLL